jgi:fermentation-respiration switch protein FrsA (DUF1100 family)
MVGGLNPRNQMHPLCFIFTAMAATLATSSIALLVFTSWDCRFYLSIIAVMAKALDLFLTSPWFATYLTQTRQLPPHRIFLYGHSLGGAVAIELASRHPQLAGIIIEGSFTSVSAVAKEISLYRLFPIDWILTQKFDSINKIPNLKMPMLFIHGTADDIVPSKMSQELYAVAPQPKQLLLVPEAGHDDVAKLGGVKYLQAIEQFIEQASKSHRNKLKTEI